MINPDDTRINYGFIAQEIEDLVTKDNAMLSVDNGEERMLGLRYIDFISPMVKAIQDLKAEINQLKNK
jgi:hypothetical protein